MSLPPFVRNTLLIGTIYLIGSCVVHYILLPEAVPQESDYPKQGHVILNQEAGERVVFTKDRFQGNPNEVIIEVDLAAKGSIPMAHLHVNMNEVFRGVEAKTELMVSGKVHTLTPGESIDIPAGIPHLPYNTSDTASRIQVTMNPIGMFDLCLVNIHRTLSRSTQEQNWLSQQLQLSRYAYFCDVYRADLPTWVQQAGLFFLTPTIRALGYHAWKETTP